MDREEFNKKLETASSKLDITDIDTTVDISIKPFVDNIPNAYDKNNVILAYNIIAMNEEFAELTKELSKLARGDGDRTAILEELADCWLNTRYAMKLCGITEEELNKAINVKTERQHKKNLHWIFGQGD